MTKARMSSRWWRAGTPLPYRGRELHAYGRIGDSGGTAEVRLLRPGLATDPMARPEPVLGRPGAHHLGWPGRGGRSGRGGIYFLRAVTGGESAELKLVVMP